MAGLPTSPQSTIPPKQPSKKPLLSSSPTKTVSSEMADLSHEPSSSSASLRMFTRRLSKIDSSDDVPSGSTIAASTAKPPPPQPLKTSVNTSMQSIGRLPASQTTTPVSMGDQQHDVSNVNDEEASSRKKIFRNSSRVGSASSVETNAAPSSAGGIGSNIFGRSASRKDSHSGGNTFARNLSISDAGVQDRPQSGAASRFSDRQASLNSDKASLLRNGPGLMRGDSSQSSSAQKQSADNSNASTPSYLRGNSAALRMSRNESALVRMGFLERKTSLKNMFGSKADEDSTPSSSSNKQDVNPVQETKGIVPVRSFKKFESEPSVPSSEITPSVDGSLSDPSNAAADAVADAVADAKQSDVQLAAIPEPSAETGSFIRVESSKAFKPLTSKTSASEDRESTLASKTSGSEVQHSSAYMKIKASKLNDYSAPVVIMDTMGRHWAADLFSWPHNGIRLEIIEMFQILSSMNRMFLDLTRADIDRFYDWFFTLADFLNDYWAYEHEYLTSPLENRKLIRKEIMEKRIKQKNLIGQYIQRLITDQNMKYEMMPAGEAVKDMRIRLNRISDELLVYLRFVTRKYGKRIAGHTTEQDWVLQPLKMVNFFKRGKNPVANSQILFRWIEDRSLQDMLIKRYYGTDSMSYMKWARQFQEEHVDIVIEFYRRSAQVVYENSQEQAERVPDNYIMHAVQRADGGDDGDDGHDGDDADYGGEGGEISGAVRNDANALDFSEILDGKPIRPASATAGRA